MSKTWKKITISASIYFLLLLGTSLFVLNPAINSLKQDRQKFAADQAALNQGYDKLDALQKASKHPEDFKNISDTVNNFWPDSSDVSHFIVQTENLAKEDNLVLDNFSIDEKKKATKKATAASESEDGASTTSTEDKSKNSTAETTTFTFGLQAPYGSVLNFLKGMETLTRYNTISSVSLSSGESGILNMRIIGNIYYGK